MTETFRPDTEEQLGEAIAWASNEKKPLSVVGLGSKSVIGQLTSLDYTLDLSALWGITHYEPDELVLTARAGTPLSEIATALNDHNQMLAFEPMDFGPVLGLPAMDDATSVDAISGTIGGMVGAGFAGPRRIRQGGVRDHVLGFRAISGRGELFKSGGKVMKNVTGFDLSKLMTGSFGTLAVMSEISIKVMPKPDKARTVLVYGLSDEDAIRCMADALNSPYEVSSAAHLPVSLARRSSIPMIADSNKSVTAIRVEGPEPSVASRCASLRDLLGKGRGNEELHTARSRAFWWATRDLDFLKSEIGVQDKDRAQVWRLSVPPSHGARVLSNLVNQCGGRGMYDWGGGQIWYVMPHQPDAAHTVVRGAIADCGGHATLVRADETVRAAVPVFQPQPEGLAALSMRIKKAFDPEGILNPGRMGAGSVEAGNMGSAS